VLPVVSFTIGVAQLHRAEEKSVAFVWCTDAARWQYCRPAGVAFVFQVKEYKIEPVLSNCCRNLLSKQQLRLALSDEPEKCWGKVPLVVKSERLTGNAKRLARW
jgi:hypothetical protein